MGIIPSWLTALDTGTMLYDADCPACTEQTMTPRLIDAWVRPHDGPAVFVPESDSLPAHYVIPDGPGLREPDIYEIVGLSAWHEWQRMGGRSSNYDEKLPKKQAVIDRLRAAYGDRLAVRVGYGIDPRIGGGRQGIREAIDTLVNRDRIDSLVVYHGVGFSDIMQTHHLRHQIAQHLEALGRGDLPVRYADPLGTTDHYVAAVVAKIQAELAQVPPDAAVAIHLSGHGLSTTMCGDYDCGADAYHRYAADLFARVRPAVLAVIDRPGRTDVFHIYGDGGEGDSDPDHRVASPIEALDARVAEGGWTQLIDIPYEFDSNSRDTLIVLRQGYQRPQPDWNTAYESHFTYRGLQVKIANANGGEAHKTDALEAVTLAALGEQPGPAAPGTAPASHHDTADPEGAGGSPHTRDTDPSIGPATEPPATAAADLAMAHGHERLRFDTVGATAGPNRDAGASGDHHGSAALEARAGHSSGSDGGGAGLPAGLALALAGGASMSVALAARRRSIGGRLAAAGLGAQLGGLGWDIRDPCPRRRRDPPVGERRSLGRPSRARRHRCCSRPAPPSPPDCNGGHVIR